MSWRLPRPRVALPPQVGHAARVALAATLLVGVVYAGCVAILDRAVSARLVASVDTRLRQRLAGTGRLQPPGTGAGRARARQARARQARARQARARRAAAGSRRRAAGRIPTTMTTLTRRPCSCGGSGPGMPRSR